MNIDDLEKEELIIDNFSIIQDELEEKSSSKG